MNELMKKQIMADYKELLSSGAGRRVLGGIFDLGGLNRPSGWPGAEAAAYQAGRRDLALAIANTVREADPLGVASCEVEYRDFIKAYGRENEDGDEYEYDHGGNA